jgi:hypothetical protein
VNGEVKEYDVVVAAVDVPGIKKLLPESFRKIQMFDNIYKVASPSSWLSDQFVMISFSLAITCRVYVHFRFPKLP